MRGVWHPPSAALIADAPLALRIRCAAAGVSLNHGAGNRGAGEGVDDNAAGRAIARATLLAAWAVRHGADSGEAADYSSDGSSAPSDLRAEGSGKQQQSSRAAEDCHGSFPFISGWTRPFLSG